METFISDNQIQLWLEGLASAESKRHESIANAIAKTLTYDEGIVAALKDVARNDPQAYARDAAKNALEKIAQTHFLAGNEIRTYLEKLRTGALAPRVVPQEPKPAPEIPAAPISPAPEPVALAPRPVVPETPRVIETPAPAETFHRNVSTTAPLPSTLPTSPSTPPIPPAPSVPFDQWLLSERNIKLALYSGGFLLMLAGLIFAGVNWAYLSGLAKLGVTLAVTLGMYAGGIVLFKRPNLKIGGTALLAIASGFLSLNFAVIHLYITDERGVSFETMWLLGSLVCGFAYVVTALWTRHNLFTAFGFFALLSSATALMRLLHFETTGFAFGYALVTLGVLVIAERVRTLPFANFMARTLRLAAHMVAPLVFLLASVAWIFWTGVGSRIGTPWLALGAMLIIFAFYAFDDWRARSLYARWCAAFAFALATIFICTEMRLSSIQTGLTLKILAAIYLFVGNFLQRGKKLDAGMPLYIVAALLAAFVSFQSLLVYTRTPEHLALALVGDVALFAIGAFLARRVEFVYGAAWLALAPVFIYGNVYLADMPQRGLALGALMLIYVAVGFRLGLPQLQWALPFLSVAAFLSVVVPAMIYPNHPVLTPVLIGIAILYAALAVRLQIQWLVLAAITAINLAIISSARLFYPFGIDLARVLAFAFCAWAVILFFARRSFAYLHLKEWAQMFAIGALANFVLTYAFVFFIALADFARYGFVSQAFGLSLVWSVALLALTAYLYRRAEFVYAAAWVFVAPAFIFAELYLADRTQVGLVMGALMLAYTAVGYWLGLARLKWGGAFLSTAAFLSVLTPTLLNPNYPVMTFVLLGIAILYGVMAVRLKFQWLVLAALAALDFALIFGARIFVPFNLDLARVVALLFTAVVVMLFLARRVLEILGEKQWAQPFAVGMLANLGMTYALAFFISAIDARAGLLSATLANTLLADVGLLALTAYLYRRVEFVYAATWLFIAPTYIFAKINFVDNTRVGLVLGALMLAYVGIAFLIGRARPVLQRAKGTVGAFLSAAVWLSLLSVAVLMPNYSVMTALLVVIGLLYAFCAVWLRWQWLTLAALLSLNLAVLTGVLSAYTARVDIQFAAAIGYGILGALLLAGAVELKRRGFLKWREPIYLVAAVDFLLAYALALTNNNALFVAISAVVAVAGFAMQWVEQGALGRMKMPPVLSYLGALVTLNGIYFATRAFNIPIEYAPVALALTCAMFVAVALVVRDARRDVLAERLYGEPLRYVGLIALVCMLIAATILFKPLAGALTFVIAACAFGADGYLRKQIALVYAGGALFVAALWWMLRFSNVTEWQAYLIPFGVLSLLIGWSELWRGRVLWYQFATVAGLVVLLVSAFYQSLSNVSYAALLLIESVAAFGIGFKMRSRIYVQAAILALVGNGLAQFGPAFVNLDRWIQIGTIGSILLLGGLVGLFRREKLLNARRALTSEWKMWRP